MEVEYLEEVQRSGALGMVQSPHITQGGWLFLGSIFTRGFHSPQALSWIALDAQRKDLSSNPSVTWKAVGTQSQAQLPSCLLQEASSRMLKQEHVFIPTLRMGVTHVPSVPSLHPIIWAPVCAG